MIKFIKKIWYRIKLYFEYNKKIKKYKKKDPFIYK